LAGKNAVLSGRFFDPDPPLTSSSSARATLVGDANANGVLVHDLVLENIALNHRRLRVRLG
jgi:hypothetical protein